MLEQRIEQSLGEFRGKLFEADASERLHEITIERKSDYSNEVLLGSLDLFRSLGAYYRQRSLIAQGINDEIFENAAPASRLSAETSLLSALEFYAHSPLRRADVEAGISRLTGIVDVQAATAAEKPEIQLWLAEGYQALGQYAQAEQAYWAALQNASDPRLTALADFRLAELVERESKFAIADSLFGAASRLQESPLRLLAMVRRAAVLRSERHFDELLAQIGRADSLFAHSEHDVRTSAREFRYSSPLVERMMLESVEEDRIVGSAPIRSTPGASEIAPSQLTSGYYPAEAALLRGSALSELGKYTEATQEFLRGEHELESLRDTNNRAFNAQELFYSNALKFERGWSLFNREKYEDAAAAFLQLASEDTAQRHLLLRSASLPLREQGQYFDPFVNDTLLVGSPSLLEPGVLGRSTIDTGFFFYNDFPERARFYAGVALERAGKRKEAAEIFTRLSIDKSILYSSRSNYQLALIRFLEGNFQAQQLLEPLSYERSLTGAYSSFLLGELAYRKQIYERAERYFFNSYANLPESDTSIRATAHLERGLSLIPLKNWQEASDELSTYLQLTHEQIPGKTDEALYWLGKAYFRIGQYDSATILLQRLLKGFPKSSRQIDAQYLYAWSLFSQNDFANAEPAFERVVAMDSISRYSYDVLARAADSYYAQDNLQPASVIYNQAIDRPAFNDLRSTRALLLLGVTRMRLDSNRSAMNLFHYITTRYPKSDLVDEAAFNEALALYSISQNSQADQLVENIVTRYGRSPVAPRALFVAAEERNRTGDISGAAGFYRRVVREYANAPEVRPSIFSLQDALIQLKRPDEAFAVGDSFISRNPESPLNHEILFRSGELQLRTGSAALAISTFRSFISQYPKDDLRPAAEIGLGRALVLSGDTAAALTQFSSVITQSDSSSSIAAQAYLERARIERSQKNYAVAAQDYQLASLRRYYATDAAPVALWEYAQMLVEEHQSDSAIAAFRDLSVRYPIEASLPARAAIREAELLSDLNQDEQAMSELRRVIAAHPKDVYGGAATVRIAMIHADNQAWPSAADVAVQARRDFALGAESEAKRLFILGIAHSHLGRKSDALKELRSAVAIKSLSPADRETANRLIAELTPRKQSPKVTPKKTSPKPAAKKKGAKR
jgi:TolA-binding protein